MRTQRYSTYLLLTTTPLPKDDPDAAALALGEPLSSYVKASLAAYRGDPEPAKMCWRAVKPEDPVMPTVALMACSAAASSGDYALFREIQETLERCAARAKTEEMKALISLPMTLIAVNIIMPSMTPEWLKKGDFSMFSKELRPFLLYLYALHLRNVGDYRGSRAVARTTLILIEEKQTFTWLEIYLHLICSGLSYYLGEMQEARESLQDALALGAPHGLIAPYAEWITGYGGMVEDMLAQQYPHLLKPVTTLWKQVHENWICFRNHYTREHITTILTIQEQHTALLYARGMTCPQVAKMLVLSESRVRSILSDVYSKLGVSRKKELKEHLLMY